MEKRCYMPFFHVYTPDHLIYGILDIKSEIHQRKKGKTCIRRSQVLVKAHRFLGRGGVWGGKLFFVG